MTDRLEQLAETVRTYFERIHREVFLGDPAANPRLKVEVLDPTESGDTPTVVLVTPWTLNGLAFPPDAAFPDTLMVGAKEYPVFAHSLPELGDYRSVNLMPDVSTLQSPESARAVAVTLGEQFRAAVARAREVATEVTDPSRRALIEQVRDLGRDG